MDTARNVSCHEVSFRVRLQEQTTCFVRTAPQGKLVKLGEEGWMLKQQQTKSSSTHLTQTPGSTSVTSRNEGQVESRLCSALLKVTGEDNAAGGY